MARRSGRINAEWQTPEGGNFEWQHVQVEVLQDIRAELRQPNALLHCQNFVEIPTVLRKIRANTTKPRKARKKATR